MKNFSKFLKEEKDDGEYGQQGGMAKSQLRMIMSAAKRLHDSLKDDDALPGHIIANIVLATDYVTGSADYMESEMNNEEEEDDYEMDDMDESKLAEEQKPAYHYYATKNGIGAKEMKLTHSKSKPFTSETDALKHLGRQNGIIHKVNSATGKVVQHRGIDGGQKGYPTPASDMAGDAPKHVRDLKEEVELDEGLYHVSYGAGLDHQVVANDAMDAHKKAMAHFKKTKPKLNDPKYADTFDKKSITRVKGDEPRSDKYKTEETTRGRFRNYVAGGTK